MRSGLPVIAFVASVVCCSCGSKDVSDPLTTATKLQRHTWILDSIRLTVDGGSPSTYLPDNRPNVPLVFDADTFSGTFFISADGTFNYQVNEPDTVYIWLPGGQLNTNKYFIVNKVDDNTLITTYTLIEPYQTSVSVDYYHAQ